MSEQPPTVLFEKRGDIAVVTLNRPDALNAFSVRMRDELWEVLGAVRDDPDVRGMLLQGAGERAFCAGADLTEFGTAPSQAVARTVRWERDVWGLLLGLPKPTVAALHGYCLGSGLEMAVLCDLRVAADDAVFGMPEAGLGLVPAAGGTQLLPRLLGPGRALDLLLSGRRFGAGEALEYGLVTQVVARSELSGAATALLQRVLRAPGRALAAAKRALAEGADVPLASALDLERRLAAGLSA
ncbi:MAG: enoyl-CoA hydratase/isomerase family protein [Chloroflexi bacterium]|nr:enoyl-CoA hydratase/isomerase family protein [Chloroflexota bacterium]